jgi:hypothetical protein
MPCREVSKKPPIRLFLVDLGGGSDKLSIVERSQRESDMHNYTEYDIAEMINNLEEIENAERLAQFDSLMERVEDISYYMDDNRRLNIKFTLDNLDYMYNVNYLIAEYGYKFVVSTELDKQVAVRAFLDDPGNF